MEVRHAKVKLCLVGANTGCKTNVVRKHVLDSFDDRYITTVGTKVTKKVLETTSPGIAHPITLDLLVWDLLSSRIFRAAASEAYARGARGILAVADMTRRRTLEELDSWIRTVEDTTGPVPVAILGANRDRHGDLEVSEAEVADVAREHHAPCFFDPSDSGDSVEAAFRYLAEAHLKSLL